MCEDFARIVLAIGYQVVGIADTGKKAVLLAAKVKPDLIIMDISMPGTVDGIAAAERIQAAHSIPVIFLTAHADDATISRSSKSGAFGHLTKPLRTSELNAAILIALHQHRIGTELLQQKKWLMTVLSSITQGVIAIDSAGHVEFLNNEAEELPSSHFENAYGTETVLVVDDLENVRRYAKHALERFGYSVMLAESGMEALELMNEHAPLSEKRSGVDRAKEWRCRPQTPRVSPVSGIPTPLSS